MPTNRANDKSKQPPEPASDMPGGADANDEASQGVDDDSARDPDEHADLLDAEGMKAEVDKIEQELALLRAELDRLAETEPAGESETGEQAATDTNPAK